MLSSLLAELQPADKPTNDMTTGIGGNTKLSIDTDTDQYWQVLADIRYQYWSNPNNDNHYSTL